MSNRKEVLIKAMRAGLIQVTGKYPYQVTGRGEILVGKSFYAIKVIDNKFVIT